MVELILEIQLTDLHRVPSENALNFVVSHTKRIYERILKTNDGKILELNLKMLER